MSTATKPNRPKSAPGRALFEQAAVVGVPSAAPLQVDEANGVIRRVKVLGRFSRNNHGLTEAVNGSEYSPACMRAALKDYEERKVKCNHPANRTEPGKERPIEDTFGVLRNCVIESDENGDPAVWADLHCLTTHPMYPRVVEDVKKGLGVYGLSHNAAAKRERFDRASKRLVIEELAIVRSVDLVDKPATNRNLWESESRPMPTTLRELLESRRKDWTKPRRKWCDLILEDEMTAPADAPVEDAGAGGDPDAALWGGFVQACMQILNGDGDAASKGKKITAYLKAHEKLTQSAEPEAPAADATESDDGDEDDSKDEPMNKQESEELATLRAERAARELCESLGYTPTSLQIEAVAGIRNPKRQRELAESYRPTGAAGAPRKTPKSAAAGTVKPPAEKTAGEKARETQESEKDDVAESFRILRG